MKKRFTFDWPVALVLAALCATVVALVALDQARVVSQILGIILALLAPSPIRWTEDEGGTPDDGGDDDAPR